MSLTTSKAAAPGAATPRRSGRRSRRLRTIWPPIALAGAVLLLWWVAAVLADSSVFPTPMQSLQSLVDDVQNPRYIESIGTTLRVLTWAYVAAVVVGAVAGLLLGLSAFWSSVTLPIVYAINSIPKITLYPVFLLFLGIGDFSRGTFAFASGVLPMFLITVEATAAVKPLHLKLAATLRLGWPRLARQILIPSVLPSLVSGMRITFGLTFLGLLLAEMFSGSSGLGFEILRNVTLARMENILGEVILIAVLALIPTLLLQMIERRVTHKYGGR